MFDGTYWQYNRLAPEVQRIWLPFSEAMAADVGLISALSSSPA